MSRFRANYSFHAVGQGLFACGNVSWANGSPFHWVFDCGTSNAQRYLNRELREYQQHLGHGSLKLLCLSHFDRDHIIGAKQLLTTTPVDTLVLPYLPLIDRLLLALRGPGDPGSDPELLDFFVDPAGHMFRVSGQLRRVVLIRGGAPPLPYGEGPKVPSADDGPRLTIPERGVEILAEDLRGDQPTPRGQVIVLEHNTPLPVGAYWEFMFYNENRPDVDVPHLRKSVLAAIQKHRKSDGTLNGTSLLSQMRDIYDGTFGQSGPQRNAISLVTYCGPLFHLFDDMQGHRYMHWHDGVCWEQRVGQPRNLSTTQGFGLGNGFGILYTGDYPLTDAQRMMGLIQHFGGRRWGRIDVLQVPHHGSHHSWFDGAARFFGNRWSVFSSSPTMHRHPSPSVVQDLQGKGPMHVDLKTRVGFQWSWHY